MYTLPMSMGWLIGVVDKGHWHIMHAYNPTPYGYTYANQTFKEDIEHDIHCSLK